MLVLDTDHLSVLERGTGAEYQRLSSRLSSLSFEDFAATIVSYEEQTRGWLAYVAKARTATEQIDAYGKLRDHLQAYCDIQVLEFDRAATAQFERLRKTRIRVGTMDLKIAAIALTHSATLLTRNTSDFRKVPGLKVEDWTADMGANREGSSQ